MFLTLHWGPAEHKSRVVTSRKASVGHDSVALQCGITNQDAPNKMSCSCSYAYSYSLSMKETLFFDHEKLIAYQRSIEFVAWSTGLLEKIPSKLSASEQLDRASTSVPLNIAEGNGKYTPPDRCRYFEIARGSALECAACLDVLVAKGKCSAEEINVGKAILHNVVSLLVGLVRRLSPDRLGEDTPPYQVSVGVDQERIRKAKRPKRARV